MMNIRIHDVKTKSVKHGTVIAFVRFMVLFNLFSSLSGCLNPQLISEVTTIENQPPLSAGQTPKSNLSPLSLELGEGCLPTVFRVHEISDLDHDVLTVRWLLLFKRDGQEVYERLSSFVLEPLENDQNNSVRYEDSELIFSRALILSVIGSLEFQNLIQEPTQLEVWISDRGFKEGYLTEVPEGSLPYVTRWPMRFFNEDCL